MKTSWNDIEQIDNYISGKFTPEELLLFRSKLLINPMLQLNVSLQKKARLLIKLYSRKKVKTEIESVHEKLFNDPAKISFQQKIMRLFYHS